MILSDEVEGYNLRLRKWLIFHLNMCVLCSVKKKKWFTMSFGHFAKSQRLLAFCVQVWVVGIWPKILFSLSSVDASHSC